MAIGRTEHVGFRPERVAPERGQGALGADAGEFLEERAQHRTIVAEIRYPDEEVVQAHLIKCIKQGYAPNLTDDELLQVGRDPFLIAYAMAAPTNRCVVSNEVSASFSADKHET